MKILCVDDLQLCRLTLCRQLESLGFDDFLECSDVASAIEILDSSPEIGLVIADQHIGAAKGMDLLAWIRHNTKISLSKVPFLMITADSDTDLILRSAMLEVDGFLVKPVGLDTLESQLSRIFRHRPKESECELCG